MRDQAKEKASIVYMGTPDFAVPPLRALLTAGYAVPLVVTQPDRRGNRGRLQPPPVKLLAEEAGLPLAQPVSVRRDPALMDKLRALHPDVMVVAAFGQILPQEMLDVPRLGCFNIHASLLPAYRGAAPMQQAILDGKAETGVTIMHMDAGLDTGDIVSQARQQVDGRDIEQLSEAQSQLGAALLLDTLPDILNGEASYQPQDEAAASYAPRIRKHDGLTDFSRSAVEEECRIRAYLGWPGVYSYWQGKSVKFYRAEALALEPTGPAGSVSSVDKEYFSINCAEGQLRILELQMAGKKRMHTAEFLRGTQLEPGMRWTAAQA